MGRPKIGGEETVVLSFKDTKQTGDDLNVAAHDEGRTRSGLLRRLVHKYLTGRKNA